jgi:predicted lipoprotein with Yx(FWY)xxD motif
VICAAAFNHNRPIVSKEAVMVEDLSRREEQHGWRRAYRWIIPLAFVLAVLVLFGTQLLRPMKTGMDETVTKGLVNQNSQSAIEPATVEAKTNPAFGVFLTDGSGHPLYLFKSDKPGSQSGATTCYGNCAKAWPPLLTSGEPKSKAPAQSGLIATTERKNGAKQVTYNGWPLYRYARDVGPTQVTGQDVTDFGGEWSLVAPSGQEVKAHNSTSG